MSQIPSSEPYSPHDEALIYMDKEPDIRSLSGAYHDALLDLDEYFESCRRAYDDRRNIWPGKSYDFRKNGGNAFPWDGASDQEVNVVGERIDAYVAMFDQALQRSHIKAFPTSVSSVPRAAMVSSFLKWMRSSYIPDFKSQMELGANYLLEKGIMISYVGWQRELRTFLQDMSLDEIAEAAPELVEMILDESDDESVLALLQQAYPNLSTKRAKKALRDFRKQGAAQIPVPRLSVDNPVAYACAPDGEVIFPAYVTDPQRAPYVFWRTFLTAQELEQKVITEGWDEEWVESAIKKLRGRDSVNLDNERVKLFTRMPMLDEDELVMVVYGYQRLIDEEDGSEGIYLTVFHPDTEGYAKFELMNGYDDYPFVVTRLSHNQKRMYEVQHFPDLLRSAQFQIKTERDSRIDRASLATLPPLMHPAGRPPSDWGPGRRIGYRRLGEVAFGPTPPMDPGSIEVEASMRAQADRAVGLDFADPSSAAKQQFYVSKYLEHVKDVLTMAWKLFQRMGPDEVFFQVTGNPNPQTMTKGSADDNFSISVAFDSMSTDPDTAETRIKQIGSLVQFDRNGQIDMSKFLEFAAMSIDPVFADYVLQPVEAAQEKLAKDITDDLAKIYAGIEVPARPNGAQAAMGLIQAYVQQPDVMQRAQSDEAFGARLQKYAEQYQFMMQQAQNAEIGRIGTNPAAMGDVSTQGMQ